MNMPNLDGTGPRGQGSQTGRGLGLCRFNMPFFGRGLRQTFRRGRGFGRFLNWPNSQADQKKMLQDYRQALKEELEDVEKELNQSDS